MVPMLKVKKIVCNAFSENTYIVSLGRECMVIDPGCSNAKETQAITLALKTHQLKPVGLLNTHAHIDHVMGLGWFAKHHQLQTIIHPKEYPVYKIQPSVAEAYGLSLKDFPKTVRFWADQVLQTFEWAGQTCRVIHTPGHSPGHVCYHWPQSNILFSGDCLFKDSIGRVDLPGGDAKAMNQSLRRLLQLPDSTVIYPGHGEATVLQQEKHSNPFLR